jgi:hypothetical protein
MTTSSQFEGSISQQPARVVNSHRDRAYSGNGEKIGESGTWGLSASRGADCSAGKASGFSPIEPDIQSAPDRGTSVVVRLPLAS